MHIFCSIFAQALHHFAESCHFSHFSPALSWPFNNMHSQLPFKTSMMDALKKSKTMLLTGHSFVLLLCCTSEVVGICSGKLDWTPRGICGRQSREQNGGNGKDKQKNVGGYPPHCVVAPLATHHFLISFLRFLTPSCTRSRLVP